MQRLKPRLDPTDPGIQSGEQILLKTEMVAGHAGVSGRYAKWRETAFEYAWVLDRLGAAQ